MTSNSARPVQSSISLSFCAQVPSEGDRGVLSSVDSRSINVSDVDLNRGVVLGANHTVGRRALAGNVQINNLAIVVLHVVKR